MLSRANQAKIVNKLCISFLLLACNDKNMSILGLLASGFLPTMKFPTIAVAIDCWFRARRNRRALFYGHYEWPAVSSQYFQALRRSR